MAVTKGACSSQGCNNLPVSNQRLTTCALQANALFGAWRDLLHPISRHVSPHRSPTRANGMASMLLCLNPCLCLGIWLSRVFRDSEADEAIMQKWTHAPWPVHQCQLLIYSRVFTEYAGEPGIWDQSLNIGMAMSVWYIG
jgi:hypothetical protein